MARNYKYVFETMVVFSGKLSNREIRAREASYGKLLRVEIM